MKKVLFIIAITFILTGTQSCIYLDEDNDIPPRGTAIRTFDFKNFDALKMGDAFRVHVTAGSNFAVSATGERNDLDDLEIFVQDGELVARYDRIWNSSRKRMDIDVVMPVLSGVDFSGAVDSDITGFENLSRIDFDMSGASRCDFEGSAKNITFELSGASEVELYGSGQFLDGELSGASKLNAFTLQIEQSDLNVSGASNANVWVTKFLKVDANGASKVRYKGNPDIEKQLSGGSSLRQE
jgi:hypothetical protein